MKTELHHYDHSENGISLRLVAETPIEEAILKALWTHGKMETGYGGKYITAFCRDKQPKESEATP